MAALWPQRATAA